MSSKLIVKTAYANIYSEPKFSSQLVTQALFFEVLEVISSTGDWFEVSQWDGYTGYTHKFYLSEDTFTEEDSFLVTDRFLSMYDSSDFNNITILVPFGSKVPIISNGSEYCMVQPIDDRNYFFKTEVLLLEKNLRSRILDFI